MKTSTAILAILIGFLATVLIVCVNNADTEHKYQVDYQHGRYGLSDYTDSITHGPDQSITYLNQDGDRVTRYGTYSISENKNYKK